MPDHLVAAWADGLIVGLIVVTGFVLLGMVLGAALAQARRQHERDR